MEIENFLTADNKKQEKIDYSLLTKDEKETLIDSWVKEIRNNKIEYPIPVISLKDAEKDFNNLKKLSCSNLIMSEDWITRYNYKYKILPYYIQNNRTGNNSSNYFHIKNRYLAGSTTHDTSVVMKWNDDRFLKQACRALIRFNSIFNMSNLNIAFHLQFYVASQFRPSSAKFIYNFFESKDILDFSSGWGDRLSGFCSSDAVSYTGIDPNTNLINDYKKQIDLYSKNKNINMICDGAEFVELEKNSFDTIFTSPPYFNCECYSDDDKQSFKNYKNYDQWRDGFLFKTLVSCWNSLKENGYLILNIADINDKYKICDEMNDFISTFNDAYYLGAIGYRISTRPNIGVDQTKVYCEPVWIWKKGNSEFNFDKHSIKSYDIF